MVLIVDKITETNRAFKKSMEMIGNECTIVTLSPQEIKTDDAFSIYEHYVRKAEKEKLEEKQLYYAFADIPYLWAVRADGLNGAIFDRNHKKAEIYFTEPIERRNVQRIEWIDEDGAVYRIDYYNRFGDKYYTEFLCEGVVQSREFYNHAQQLVLLEQMTEGVITVFQDGVVKKRYIGYSGFLQTFLKEAALQEDNIVFGDETSKALFKDTDMESVKVLDINKDNIYLNNRKPEDKFGAKEALILTGTDQVESVEELIRTFPEIQFHIAANTLMSDKLMRLESYTNVLLYPCVSEIKRIDLLEKCSLYLDINHWGEIYDAVPMASLYSLIILGFDTTVHHKELILEEHICPVAELESLKRTIRLLLSDPVQYGDRLYRQRELFEQMRIEVIKRVEV